MLIQLLPNAGVIPHEAETWVLAQNEVQSRMVVVAFMLI